MRPLDSLFLIRCFHRDEIDAVHGAPPWHVSSVQRTGIDYYHCKLRRSIVQTRHYRRLWRRLYIQLNTDKCCVLTMFHSTRSWCTICSEYITNLLMPASDITSQSSPRSSATATYKKLDARSMTFSIAAFRAWNRLPNDLTLLWPLLSKLLKAF